MALTTTLHSHAAILSASRVDFCSFEGFVGLDEAFGEIQRWRRAMGEAGSASPSGPSGAVRNHVVTVLEGGRTRNYYFIPADVDSGQLLYDDFKFPQLC